MTISSSGSSHPDHQEYGTLWGSITRPLVVSWGFNAARSYSSMRPPRLVLATGRQRQAIDLFSGRVIQAGAIDDPALALAPATSGLIALDGLAKVTGDGDGNITVQDANSTRPLPEGHGRGLTVVVCRNVYGRALAFTGAQDARVRIWDLGSLQRLDIIEVPGPVLGLEAASQGDLVVLTGTEAIAFRHGGTAESGAGIVDSDAGTVAGTVRRDWL